VRLAEMAATMHASSVREMAQILGMSPPISLRKLEQAFLKLAIPKPQVDLDVVLLTNLDTNFNPGFVTLSWVDPGALTFARATSFEVTYFFLGFSTPEILWHGFMSAVPGPVQRMATTLTDLSGGIGDSTGTGQWWLSVQPSNAFAVGKTSSKQIDV